MRAGLFGEAYRETDFDEMCCPVELWMNKSDEAAVPRDGSFANIMDRKDDSLVMIVENLGGFKLKEYEADAVGALIKKIAGNLAHCFKQTSR